MVALYVELLVAPTFFVVSGMEECSSDAWSGPGAHAGRRQRDFLASLPLLGGPGELEPADVALPRALRLLTWERTNRTVAAIRGLVAGSVDGVAAPQATSSWAPSWEAASGRARRLVAGRPTQQAV